MLQTSYVGLLKCMFVWHASTEQFLKCWKGCKHDAKSMGVHWNDCFPFKAETQCCMEHHNFGSVSLCIISACHCLAYCIYCRVCLLDRQRLSTWRVCDAPQQEAGRKKGKFKCVCVFFWVAMCVKLLWNLSKNRLHASSGKAHNNSKASHWQRLSIAVKGREFDKWILLWTSTSVGSAWENQGEMLRGWSVLSPKCHVWEHRRGSLLSQTVRLRLTKWCLFQAWPGLSNVHIRRQKNGNSSAKSAGILSAICSWEPAIRTGANRWKAWFQRLLN